MIPDNLRDYFIFFLIWIGEVGAGESLETEDKEKPGGNDDYRSPYFRGTRLEILQRIS